MSTLGIRRLIFLVSLSLAFAAVGMLAIGGFLTMKPALIGAETADQIRSSSLTIIAICGVAALLTSKREWLQALRPH